MIFSFDATVDKYKSTDASRDTIDLFDFPTSQMASTSLLHPSITVTTPTPPRPLLSTQLHRLLYRGSLSLPDSHLLLDGLTFTGHAGKSTNLLENPLALALESMRGRPTLRFLGTMILKEGWIDYSGDVCL